MDDDGKKEMMFGGLGSMFAPKGRFGFPKPEELASETAFAGIPEEIVDCAESDFILDGIEKFMRWQSHLAFAECVSERGLLR